MPADLFIGLVTHPRSRFSEASTDRGLAQQIFTAVRELGASAELAIVNEDLLQPGQLILSKDTVKDSIVAELELEMRWREYVSGQPTNFANRILVWTRRIKRALLWAPPWKFHLEEGDAGVRMITRLANIEFAHLAAMSAAVASKARWILIVEDDAQSNAPADLAAQLLQFIAAADKAGHPRVMNLSESFTTDQLGITHLLSRQTLPCQPESWQTFSCSKLITNTVCAVLYERSFLTELLDKLNEIPLAPVVPIDFKLNAAFLSWGEQQPGTCWVCSPAPIAQGSGVPTLLI